MGVRRNSNGPLRHSTLTQIGSVDSTTFWDRTAPPPIEPLDTDETYVVQMADRVDLLAFRKVGSSQLGWAIMERNSDIVPEEVDMRLWPNDFVPGRPIKIPSRVSLRDRGISQ